MPTIRISRELITEAMQSEGVRDALEKKADALAARADQLGASEGVTMNATVRVGTRPKGRPFAYVESENVAQEFGDRNTERRRILGRVAEEG